MLRVTAAQAEKVADGDAMASRLQLDPRDLRCVRPERRCGTSGDRSSRWSGFVRSVNTSGFTAADP